MVPRGDGATGGDATVSTDAQTLLDKQATLAKQLQDEMVAMTKTAVDDMQLEYDRLEAHIIEVDGAISASWQKVLDGRQADIAAVGLAEQFPALAIIEDMEIGGRQSAISSNDVARSTRSQSSSFRARSKHLKPLRARGDD